MQLTKDYFIEYYKTKVKILERALEEEIQSIKQDELVDCMLIFSNTLRDICFYKCLVAILESN